MQADLHNNICMIFGLKKKKDMRETCNLRNEGKAPGMGTEKQKTFSLSRTLK